MWPTARKQPLSSPFIRFWILGVVVLSLIAGHSLWSGRAPSLSFLTADGQHIVEGPLVHRHVAFTTTFGSHSEVWGAVAWTMERVFAREWEPLPRSISLYPNNAGFVQLLNKLGVLKTQVMTREHDFLTELAKSDLYDDDFGAPIDLVVFGTCELDLQKLGPQMLEIWDARPADQKFTIVCIVHNAGPNFWYPVLPDWSKRGAIRFLSIADHVGSRFKAIFADQAGGTDTALAGFQDHVKMNSIYPVSDLTAMIPTDRDPQRRLTHASIQGNYQQHRRDYERVFRDLLALMREDPTAWGYHPIGENGSYEPMSEEHAPFKLHLIGAGKIDIPKELTNMIVLDSNLGTEEFYEKIISMDIMVPAFNKAGGYLYSQGSSTVHTSVECSVPILATVDMLNAYKYLEDDVSAVIRPHGLSEMEALRLLRTGDPETSRDILSRGPPAFRQAIAEMLEKGWKRTPEQWMTLKQSIWKRNEAMVSQLLREIA